MKIFDTPKIILDKDNLVARNLGLMNWLLGRYREGYILPLVNNYDNKAEIMQKFVNKIVAWYMIKVRDKNISVYDNYNVLKDGLFNAMDMTTFSSSLPDNERCFFEGYYSRGGNVTASDDEGNLKEISFYASDEWAAIDVKTGIVTKGLPCLIGSHIEQLYDFSRRFPDFAKYEEPVTRILKLHEADIELRNALFTIVTMTLNSVKKPNREQFADYLKKFMNARTEVWLADIKKHFDDPTIGTLQETIEEPKKPYVIQKRVERISSKIDAIDRRRWRENQKFYK